MYTLAIRLLAACMLIQTVGCVSTTTEEVGGANAVVIVLNTDGTLTIGRKTVARTGLAQALKSAGVRTDSTLLVKIPAGTTPATLGPIDGHLRSAGYTHILYQGRKYADVTAQGQAPVKATPPKPER